jgi:hypothetical protein
MPKRRGMRFLEFEVKREDATIDGLKGRFLMLGVNGGVYMAFSFSGSAADLVIFNLIPPLNVSAKFLRNIVSITEGQLEEVISDSITVGEHRVERRSANYIVRNRVRKLRRAAGVRGERLGVRYLSITT